VPRPGAIENAIDIAASADAVFDYCTGSRRETGHAEVAVDGVQTVDRTVIWQNKSSSGRSIPDAVLFAWRWPTAGTHTIEIRGGVPNGKEAGSFFHMTGYWVVP
jgi:hypothetical protein